MNRKEEIREAVRHHCTCDTEEQQAFIEGAEWADKNPDSSWSEKLKLEKEEWLDKAVEWLENNICEYAAFYDDKIIEDFRKAIEI